MGKERDEETGYGYFGARYMDHELMTGWLSVDPMADKYPSVSPYAYCAWNPVKLVDPDGREIGDYYSRNGTYLGWDGQINNKVYIVDDKEILEKDHNNNINTNNVTPLVSTTYETLEAVVGVFERTINNGGGNEESTAVIAGCSAIRGEQGYMGFDGKPHCEFPFLTEDQESLGVTSIHSHPFVEGYSIIEPSADDKALFGSCDMNIIVGPKGGGIWAAFFKPSSDRITELRINSIEKIVNNRQNASNRRWGLLCKDL